jgi:16S rRNA (guanine527-N7)-methyltransferase
MTSAATVVTGTEIGRRLAAAGLPVSESQAAQLAQFVELLLRWNRVHNLTGIRGVDEILDRHLVESLALGPHLHGERIADVGSGGGLPGMPLAITEPARRFTLIESRVKRVAFLRHAAAELGLSNTSVAHGRAEHLHLDQPFDTVLTRALAPPKELLEICRPLLAPGSALLMLTAPHLGEQFRGLAPDFAWRDLSQQGPRTGLKLKSSIVLMERIDV